jgi:hypothetical protein
MRSFALLALGLTLSAGPVAAQVLLRINPPDGQATRYRLTMEMFMTGGPMASMITDTSLPVTRMTLHQTRTVTARSGDQVTFRETTDSASIESPAMPQMAQMMEQSAGILRGMVAEQVMTTRGKLVSQRVVNRPARPASPAGPMPGPNADNMRMPVMLPERPVRPGDSWSDTTTIKGDHGTMSMVGKFRFERMEGATAVVSTAGSMTIPTTIGGTMTMQTTGEVRLDTAASRFGNFRMEGHGTVPMGQMGEARMRMRITGVLIGS